jgi:uroporphyrin-III C-methyltransferase/precorrin-2 dehydrogenase/sirohydrochlorin ferrochelatase
VRYFPLFADLRGRRVLVVGGGEVAARKVRLLREAGAGVELVSREIRAAELREWIASGTTSGGAVHWLAREFDPAQVDGATLVKKKKMKQN